MFKTFTKTALIVLNHQGAGSVYKTVLIVLNHQGAGYVYKTVLIVLNPEGGEDLCTKLS